MVAIRVVATIAICAACAGCGNFRLAAGGQPPLGKTRDQQTLDVLVCKDRARVESQTAADQARGFLLGFTLSFVGVVLDYEAQKQDQRRIFKDCLESKGYAIVPATD